MQINYRKITEYSNEHFIGNISYQPIRDIILPKKKKSRYFEPILKNNYHNF